MKLDDLIDILIAARNELGRKGGLTDVAIMRTGKMPGTLELDYNFGFDAVNLEEDELPTIVLGDLK